MCMHSLHQVIRDRRKPCKPTSHVLLIPLLYRLGKKGLAAAHGRAGCCGCAAIAEERSPLQKYRCLQLVCATTAKNINLAHCPANAVVIKRSTTWCRICQRSLCRLQLLALLQELLLLPQILLLLLLKQLPLLLLQPLQLQLLLLLFFLQRILLLLLQLQLQLQLMLLQSWFFLLLGLLMLRSLLVLQLLLLLLLVLLQLPLQLLLSACSFSCTHQATLAAGLAPAAMRAGKPPSSLRVVPLNAVIHLLQREALDGVMCLGLNHDSLRRGRHAVHSRHDRGRNIFGQLHVRGGRDAAAGVSRGRSRSIQGNLPVQVVVGGFNAGLRIRCYTQGAHQSASDCEDPPEPRC
mmetsp:Transcript_75767/g.235219  ORF Transcript_75767/g.235219 Transcript_75767/m.235219 type:complete len:349 (+) Transcript_75767:849-1895(+)